ncbi:hypothetical protein M8J76_000155 [Diaphorina citri]|nr:hypothetical protein M8J75_010068 [Diaphorina citri]KAI5716057.1 hypothetical protein M8J76_000155 [Diaphorina citri]KAI5717145.1 hypothetical protein M8J77_000880 [Diaphorina citri]
MAILPIPACMETYCGMELRSAMKMKCVIIIVLALMPLILLYAFCSPVKDYRQFLPLVVIIPVAIIFILVFIEDTPGWIHFIFNVVWWFLTFFMIGICVWATVDRMHAACGTVLKWFLYKFFWIACAISLLNGIEVYWSFYVNNE